MEGTRGSKALDKGNPKGTPAPRGNTKDPTKDPPKETPKGPLPKPPINPLVATATGSPHVLLPRNTLFGNTNPTHLTHLAKEFGYGTHISVDDEDEPLPYYPQFKKERTRGTSNSIGLSTPLEIPEEFGDIIDLEHWGSLARLADLPYPSSEQVNTLIGTAVALWKRRDLFGGELHAHFTSIFEGWNKTKWDQASPTALKVMRNELMNRGVFIGTQHQSVKNDLINAATRDAFQIWDPVDLYTWARKTPYLKAKLENTKHHEELTKEWKPPQQQGQLRPPGQQGYPHQTSEQSPHRAAPLPATLPVREPANPPPEGNRTSEWARIHQARTQGPPDLNGTGPFQNPNPMDPVPYAPYELRPPEPRHQVPRDERRPKENTPPFTPRGSVPIDFIQPTPKQFMNFEKLYSSNNDSKYGGGFDDVLDTKIQIFKDNCERLSIPEGCSATLFPTILKDKAKEYYYNELFNSPDKRDFEFLVAKFRTRFQTEEARQFYLAEWRLV